MSARFGSVSQLRLRSSIASRSSRKKRSELFKFVELVFCGEKEGLRLKERKRRACRPHAAVRPRQEFSRQQQPPVRRRESNFPDGLSLRRGGCRRQGRRLRQRGATAIHEALRQEKKPKAFRESQPIHDLLNRNNKCRRSMLAAAPPRPWHRGGTPLRSEYRS